MEFKVCNQEDQFLESYLVRISFEKDTTCMLIGKLNPKEIIIFPHILCSQSDDEYSPLWQRYDAS